MILSSILGIIGVALTMIENFYVLILGRILFGIASGCQGALTIRMINEFMPARLLGISMGGFVGT